MKLNHVALMVSSVENAELFYRHILGFEKIKEFNVSKEMSKIIFNQKQELQVLVYEIDTIRFEIFVISNLAFQKDIIPHCCIEVKNRAHLIELCKMKNIQTIIIPKGDTFYLFIRDLDGNLFEVKDQIK